MEQLTKVDRAEDPWFAVRTALGMGLAVLLAEPLGITVPMLPAAFALAFYGANAATASDQTDLVQKLAAAKAGSIVQLEAVAHPVEFLVRDGT